MCVCQCVHIKFIIFFLTQLVDIVNLNVIQSETAQMDCGPINGDFYYDNCYPNGVSVDEINGGVTITNNVLTILTVNGEHENIYYCSSGGADGTLLRSFNLTVLGKRLHGGI